MKIISFEGIEGVGKTTIITSLLEKLKKKKKNNKIEYYKEPMYFREEIFSRSIEENEYLFLLFSTSRKKMLESINKKADLVIIERYIDSTLVYQFLLPKAKGKKVDTKTFFVLTDKIVFGNNKNFYPLITFVLEADIEDLKKRKIDKSFNTDDEVIQKLYKFLPYIYTNRRFVYFNTSKENKEEIVEKVLQEVNKIL